MAPPMGPMGPSPPAPGRREYLLHSSRHQSVLQHNPRLNFGCPRSYRSMQTKKTSEELQGRACRPYPGVFGLQVRRCGRCGVQEGREVLVRVRVLVLVVVLMELEGHRRDAGLVLRRPARRTRSGVRCRLTTWSGAPRGRRVVFSPRDTASAVAVL
ncbi:hypothetical protein EYF80_038178 [Liparis tanakae]|uniref:Uncharacterized protein n=1 Tax=Liparis tanakae TaxID=230148 RepID=A0A4Z2GG09_9TELE|nr:hypothetical protein EYF80_038178 [Liparis tanakae]